MTRCGIICTVIVVILVAVLVPVLLLVAFPQIAQGSISGSSLNFQIVNVGLSRYSLHRETNSYKKLT